MSVWIGTAEDIVTGEQRVLLQTPTETKLMTPKDAIRLATNLRTWAVIDPTLLNMADDLEYFARLIAEELAEAADKGKEGGR